MAYCLSGVWVKKLFLCKSFWHFFCDFFWYFALPKRHRKPVKRWRRAEKKKKEKEKRKPKKSIKPLETLFQGITLRWGFFYWNGKEEKKEKTKRRPKRDWTGGFVGAVFWKPDGHAVACLVLSAVRGWCENVKWIYKNNVKKGCKVIKIELGNPVFMRVSGL